MHEKGPKEHQEDPAVKLFEKIFLIAGSLGLVVSAAYTIYEILCHTHHPPLPHSE